MKNLVVQIKGMDKSSDTARLYVSCVDNYLVWDEIDIILFPFVAVRECVYKEKRCTYYITVICH